MLDTLFLYYECNADATPISENFYPTVVAESMFGDFEEALYHLHKKLIATKNPEEIRGGGLLKYCNLLCRGYRPASHEEVKTMERYMCSRFFIDFPDLNQQQGKLENYLYNHFQSSEDQTKYHYLMILYQVVDESTVCLMGHERRLTLTLIEDMAFQVSFWIPTKGGLVEKLIYNSQHTAIWVSPPRTESRAFVFERKKTYFLTAKHWLSQLPVTQKLSRAVLKKVNTAWVTEKKIQIWMYICWELYISVSFTETPLLNSCTMRWTRFWSSLSIFFQKSVFDHLRYGTMMKCFVKTSQKKNSHRKVFNSLCLYYYIMGPKPLWSRFLISLI